MEYTHQVLAELPGSVRGSMGKNYMNWTTFIQNVKAIDIDHMKEQARSEAIIWELNAKVERLTL
jgi:hypothetical protein